MADDQIYQVLDGHISGEGSEQLLLFMYPRNESNSPEKLHQVIEANDRYAVIKKSATQWNPTEYYLTGISDEEQYFIHDIPKHLGEKRIEEILDAVNFTSQGFMRIQGDILLKFVPIENLEIREKSSPRYETIGFINKKEKLIPESLYPKEVNLKLDNTWNSQLFFARTWEFDERLGNHKILTEQGKVLHNAEQTQRLVFGKSLTLVHSQHEQVTIKIPGNRVAVLTMQQSATKKEKYD